MLYLSSSRIAAENSLPGNVQSLNENVMRTLQPAAGREPVSRVHSYALRL